MTQLALLDAPKKKEKAVQPCACGHEDSQHRASTGACMWQPLVEVGKRHELATYEGKSMTRAEWRRKLGLEVDACKCKRFRERARRGAPTFAPNIVRPPTAIDWYRGPPEIKSRKLGGWVDFKVDRLIASLTNTKLESLNKTNRGAFGISNEMLRRLIAGDATKRKAQTLRTVAAIETAKVVHLGAPKRTVITRVAPRRLKDDDNLIGACKAVRDGVAEALLFDDELFSINGLDPSRPAIFYENALSGARKVYATQIELFW